ncbi:MAG TPA: hypothetical protein VM290_06665 [Gaiellaceae bacterium]|nr:hypothetical protein [Gaiellaceae bacterium]
MGDGVRTARAAVARGSNAEALVHLWNALEPARLAGDRRRLAAIGALAQRILADGDEAEAREAERLLEALRATVEDAGAAPATARVDADVSAGGEELAAGDFDLASVDAAEEGEAETRASRIGNLLWLVIVVAVILFNVLGQLRDGG